MNSHNNTALDWDINNRYPASPAVLQEIQLTKHKTKPIFMYNLHQYVNIQLSCNHVTSSFHTFNHPLQLTKLPLHE